MLPLPLDEDARLATLRSYAVLDTPPERDFDDLAALAALVCQTPIALIGFIDKERQWYKARVGFGLAETPRVLGFCDHAIQQNGGVFVVRDTSADPRFARNPFVLGESNIRFYAGAPVVARDGAALGTVCVLDRRPRDLDESQAQLLDATARQVMAQLELRRALAHERERTALEEELRREGEFRERFIGILGHDLRNPLSAIAVAAHVLSHQSKLPPAEREVVTRIASSASRMARMVDDLLDLSHSRLKGGIPIAPRLCDLAEICRQAVSELELANPDRKLEFQVKGDGGRGYWDPDRMAQVVSNLVGNALQHGAVDAPVRVVLRGSGPGVQLEVGNQGPPIPEEEAENLFDPFRRGALPDGASVPHRSLGLGLYIVHEIVTAHGGEIGVRSSQREGTTFTIRLPRRRDGT